MHNRKYVVAQLRPNRRNVLEQGQVVLEAGMTFDMPVDVLLQLGELFGQEFDAIE
jgi:hypothetical protein